MAVALVLLPERQELVVADLASEATRPLLEIGPTAALLPGTYSFHAAPDHDVVGALLRGPDGEEASARLTESSSQTRVGPLELTEVGHYELLLDLSGETYLHQIEVVNVRWADAQVEISASAVVRDQPVGTSSVDYRELGVQLGPIDVEIQSAAAGPTAYGMLGHLVTVESIGVRDRSGRVHPMEGVAPVPDTFPVYSQFELSELTRNVVQQVQPPPVSLLSPVLDSSIASLTGEFVGSGEFDIVVEGSVSTFVPACTNVHDCGEFDLASTDIAPMRLDSEASARHAATASGRQLDIMLGGVLGDLLEADMAAEPLDELEGVVNDCTQNGVFSIANCNSVLARFFEKHAQELDELLGLDGLLSTVGAYTACEVSYPIPFAEACRNERSDLRNRFAEDTRFLVSSLALMTHRVASTRDLDLEAPWVSVPLAGLTAVGEHFGVQYPDYYPLYYEVAAAMREAGGVSPGMYGAICVLPASFCGASTSNGESVERCLDRDGLPNDDPVQPNSSNYHDCHQVVTVGVFSSIQRYGFQDEWMTHAYAYATKELNDRGQFDGIGAMWSTTDGQAWVTPRRHAENPNLEPISSYVTTQHAMTRLQSYGGITYTSPCSWDSSATWGLLPKGVAKFGHDTSAGFFSGYVDQVKQEYGIYQLPDPMTRNCRVTSTRNVNVELSYIDVLAVVSPATRGNTAQPVAISGTYGHTLSGFRFNGFSCNAGASATGPSGACGIHYTWEPYRDAWEIVVPMTVYP